MRGRDLIAYAGTAASSIQRGRSVSRAITSRWICEALVQVHDLRLIDQLLGWMLLDETVARSFLHIGTSRV
jgi:hypothetical protein